MGHRIAVICGGTTPAEAEKGRLAGAFVRTQLEEVGCEAVVLEYGEGLAADLTGGRFDAALPVLRGPLARSGAVQALLELVGIPFVGSERTALLRLGSASGLAEALDAALAREEIEAGMPALAVLPAACIDELGALEVLEGTVLARIPDGYPLLVEADLASGSKSGRTVENAAELESAVRALANAGCDAVVRAHTGDVELAVCVLGDAADPLVMPTAEVLRDTDGAIRGWCMPVIPERLAHTRENAEAVRSEVERAALDAYLALGVRDLACLRLAWDGGQVRVLGVDLAPCLAEDELLAVSCATAQVSLAEVLSALVETAVERG